MLLLVAIVMITIPAMHGMRRLRNLLQLYSSTPENSNKKIFASLWVFNLNSFAHFIMSTTTS